MVAGHTHENEITPFPDPEGPGGFWQITSPAIADWPPQHRLIEVMDNRDGTLSIFATLLDFEGPLAIPESGTEDLCGQGGNDDVHGGRGPDLVRGDAGRDTLDGGRGADKVKGGRGRDVLSGGPGDDVCNGGRGHDVADRSCERVRSATRA